MAKKQQIEITAIKILKNEMPAIHYKRSGEDNQQSEVDENGKNIAHKDFKGALQAMAPHLAGMTGCIETGPAKTAAILTSTNQKTIAQITVTGFSIGGEDEDEGINLKGYRTLPNKKTVTLNAPFYRFNEDDKTRYKFMDDLLVLLEDAKTEAVKFLGGKFAPEPQGKLALTEEEAK